MIYFLLKALGLFTETLYRGLSFFFKKETLDEIKPIPLCWLYNQHGLTPPAFVGHNTAPSMTTGSASSIGTTSFVQEGNITSTNNADPTVRGFVYLQGASGDPTLADSIVNESGSFSTGSYTLSITGLTAGTTYRIRAYATNSFGTGYGTTITVTTLALPTVTTQAVSAIASTTATGNGNVTSDGGATVTERGVVVSTSPNPTTADSKFANGSGTGVFTASITGLNPATLYYVRAYAINSVGTSYGSEVTFTTNAPSANSVRNSELSGIATDNSVRSAVADGVYPPNTWEIQRKTDGGSWETIEEAIYIEDIADLYIYDNNPPLMNGSIYCYRVRELNVPSDWSNEDCVEYEGEDILEANSSRAAVATGAVSTLDSRDSELSAEATIFDYREAEVEGFSVDDSNRPAETTGFLTGNDSRSSEVTGRQNTDDSREAEVNAKDISDDSRDSELHGEAGGLSNTSAESTGVDDTDSSVTAESHGQNDSFTTRDAEVFGQDNSNNSIPAETSGVDTESSERAAEVEGALVETSERASEIYGIETLSNSRAAELEGGTSLENTRLAETVGFEDDLDSRAAETYGTLFADNDISAEATGFEPGNSEVEAELSGEESVTNTIFSEATGSDFDEDERASEIHGQITTDSTTFGESHGEDTGEEVRSAEAAGFESSDSSRGAETEGEITGVQEESSRVSELTAFDNQSAYILSELTGAELSLSNREAELSAEIVIANTRPSQLRGESSEANNRGAELSGLASSTAHRFAELSAQYPINTWRIQRSVDGGAWITIEEAIFIEDFDGVYIYDDLSFLTVGSNYCYRVMNLHDDSDWSEPVCYVFSGREYQSRRAQITGYMQGLGSIFGRNNNKGIKIGFRNQPQKGRNTNTNTKIGTRLDG